MNYKKRKVIYRIISTLTAVITLIMAFSLNPLKVHAETDFNAFPYGYRTKLKELNSLHPNWTFIPLNTGLDWNEAVTAEAWGNRSAIYNGKDVKDSWKSKEAGDYDPATGTYKNIAGNNWIRASREAVEYHLNPINYFDEYHIFAFEQLSYNPSIHNVDGVEAIIANSWMSYRPLEDGSSAQFNYSSVFIQNAMDSGVSPYHLASRVLQEQGRGSVQNKANYNPLISGAYGVYNYYNFGASGKNDVEVIANGVAYAEKKGWTSRFKSLTGGAQIIGADYINRGQDSLYLQKFDVDRSDGSLYNHQYMQNIQAPMSEAGLTYRAYQSCNSLNQNFVFEIPVYNNMPGNEPEVSVEQVMQFVTRLYNVCLDRDPDAGGLEHWTSLLVEKKLTGAEVAYEFFFSEEFINKNYCNECYVKHLYNALLGREYDQQGLEHWVGLLESGETREAVISGFIISNEFNEICQNYGINRGDSVPNSRFDTTQKGICTGCGKQDNVTLFVTRLYNVCLEREPEEEGLYNHCNALWNHSLSATQVAYGFVFSEEFLNHNYDDHDFLVHLYASFMKREPDADGEEFWMNKLAGEMTREEVFYGFASSEEFKDICKTYGVSN